MSDIWEITQKINADEMYKNSKDGYLYNSDGEKYKIPSMMGGSLFGGKVFAVSQLTKVCSEMIQAYDDVISDQNDYIIEIDDERSKVDNTISDIEDQIEKLKKEILALEEKVEKGTATDEEKEELDSKYREFRTLSAEVETVSDEARDTEVKKNEERKTAYKSKQAAAEDYAETTIEKGTPLAETHVSHGFFKKLLGKTGKNKKRVGEKAVKIGNELLDKIGESANIDTNIEKKIHSRNIK